MKHLFLFSVCLVTVFLPAQELKPTLTQALIKVKALDDKRIAQTKNTITFSSKKDGKQYSGVTNETGQFSLLLPIGQKYKVKYKAFATVESDLELELPLAKSPYSMEYTITVTPPKNFTLDNVFFDSGKSNLRPESSKELNELAEYMGLQKKLVIEIAGHTDNVGAAEANLLLSENRAKAVKSYLEKKGIAAERIIAKGYGDTEPVEENTTATRRQKNRRTEVRIISE
jgi:outer membrane protein OmpA-like peptidoglycan-associated protein